MVKLEEAVKSVATQHGLRLVYLFGSHATRQATTESDVDLAVLFPDDSSLDDQLRVAVELEKRIGKDVDLTDLTDASPRLHKEVLNHGICVYDKENHRPAFEAKARSRYHDMKPHMQHRAKTRKQRMMR